MRSHRSLGARYVWGWQLSSLSAPWLLVPFVAGYTQWSRRDAALIGLLVTFAALGGYFAMMWSPFEGVSLLHGREIAVVAGHLHSVQVSYPPVHVIEEVLRLLASQAPWILGGAITGPLFGLLGNEWRADRSWRSGLTIAAAFVLEPIAVPVVHALFSWMPRFGGFGSSDRVGPFQVAEAVLGLVLAIGVDRQRCRAGGWVRRGSDRL